MFQLVNNKPPVKIAHVYLNEIPPNLIHEITVVTSSALMDVTH